MRYVLLLAGAGILSVSIWAGVAEDAARGNLNTTPNAAPIDVDRGAAGLSRWLAAIRTRASILMVTAHPDDEDGGMLASESRGRGTRATLMTLNRGEGGQNAMSTDLYDELGLLRTQELLRADRYYGVDQYWGTVIDYGFSKTREEALDKWGYDRVLSDVVRVIRMRRPLIVTSVFAGAPTDGHGNHQVAGQMAQEAYVAAGDPNRFPEQLREGLRPWSPLKVYARVPFFAPTKEKTIFDYATNKYVPIRFRDYVNKTWISERPPTTVEIPEGILDPAAGLTYLQISRTGWGYQKSQNGGNTTPPPANYSAPYHRYGARIPAADKEKSFYDGIDISLAGIASLATGDTAFLKAGLEQISKLANDACERYRPNSPAAIAPTLTETLKATRSLRERVEASGLGEPGKSDVAFELHVKEEQLTKALTVALGLSFHAYVAPEREPNGRFGSGQTPTFTMAIPGQSFSVDARLVNGGPETVTVAGIDVAATDGKHWNIHAAKPPEASLAGGHDSRSKFSVTAPQDAQLTKAYFTRRDREQPYYDLTDERFRNLSLAPYPMAASVKLEYQGTAFDLRQVVQTNQRIEGIGIVENPLLVAPAISVSLSPSAGAVPLESKSFAFSCTLRSNVKGPAQGALRLRLPEGWNAAPAQIPFSFARDGDGETFTFQITPHNIQAKKYEIRAVADYAGKTYEEGFRLVGYAGLRPYPYYRPASYQAVGVDVKTAPGLRVAFLPGTGDDVPRALEDLGLHVQVLSGSDIENGNLSGFDAIVLGVRAYAVRPDLRAANGRLLNYVKNGGVLIVQYNLQNFDHDYGPYPFSLGSNAAKVVDENSQVKFLDPNSPAFAWPNRITPEDFKGWEEERGHGFMEKWDSRYQALVETHDPDQDPQKGGLLLAHYGKGIYIYDAFALYRQLPSGVPGAFRILANLVSVGKNPQWK